MKETILITGANRGIGLEFTTQYAKEGANIIATCRDPNSATELKDLQKQYPNIQIYPLDVAYQEDIDELENKITQPIDILINCAGILEHDSELGNISVEAMVDSFIINAVGPLKVTEALIEPIAKSNRKLVVSLSSRVGSIADNTSGGYYSYRAGKVALNMVMKSAAIDLQSKGIKVLLLHPGWVKTRMGGPNASLPTQDSVAGMRKVIQEYNPKLGEVSFYNYKGESIPW